MENSKLDPADPQFNFEETLEELTNLDNFDNLELDKQPTDGVVDIKPNTSATEDVTPSLNAELDNDLNSELDTLASLSLDKPESTDDFNIDLEEEIMKEVDYMADIEAPSTDMDVHLNDNLSIDSNIQSNDLENNGVSDDLSIPSPVVTDHLSIDDINLEDDLNVGSSRSPSNDGLQVEVDSLNDSNDDISGNAVTPMVSAASHSSVTDTKDFNIDSNTQLETESVSDLTKDTSVSEESLAVSATPPPPPVKTNSANLLKILAAVIGVSILGLLAFLFLGNSSDDAAKEPVVKEDTVQSQTTGESPQQDSTVNNTAEPTSQDGTENQKLSNEETGPTSAESEVSNHQDAKDGSSSAKDNAETKTDEESKESNDVNVDKSTIEGTQVKTPDPDSILNAEIPTDDALVKEEIDKLNDQGDRLGEQEQLLDKRVEMMDELTSKKQEQIELLEKQIAQLEAAQKNSN